MKLCRAVIILIGTLLSGVSLAGPGRFDSVAAFIATIPDSLPDQSITARGDLTGDGLEDAAVVVASGNDPFERSQQLHILISGSSGHLVLAASSQQAPMAGMGCCWVEALDISKGSVYIQNNAKTACDIESATHQFKLYRGIWRLMGLKITDYRRCEEPQLYVSRDTNVLTGRTIHLRQTGERPPRTWATRVSPEVALLSDYDFFNGFGAQEP
jgi:hypothetical protein